jgi:hypothetical protein
VTQREKLLISYAPGVHAGSDSSTGSVPTTPNVIDTCSVRVRPAAASKATS